MGEVRDHHHNLAVEYYDYQKAYDTVRHDWMLRVHELIGIETNVQNVIKGVMKIWKIRVDVRNENQLLRSQWIGIKKEFFQGNLYSPTQFCCTEIPAMTLHEESDGYKLGNPGKREIKCTHSLFIDDLTTNQQNHQKLSISKYGYRNNIC